MAATSARFSGSVVSARRSLRPWSTRRTSGKGRSWSATMVPHPNGVSRENPSSRRNSRVSAEVVIWGIIALTSGGSRSATAHCTYPR